MAYEISRVSAKGQLTIPVAIRKQLSIHEGDYLQAYLDENGIHLRKIEPVQPLSAQDPIWRLIGVGASGQDDVSVNHDKYLAANAMPSC